MIYAKPYCFHFKTTERWQNPQGTILDKTGSHRPVLTIGRAMKFLGMVTPKQK